MQINRQVWDIVQAADYELLWRSVDAYGPPPIDVCLELLSELQNTGRISDELEIWLHHIDFTSSDIVAIVLRGKVQCRDLYDLFREQTGSKITLSSFGTAMYKLSNDPRVPFERRRKVEKGRVYPVKQGVRRLASGELWPINDRQGVQVCRVCRCAGYETQLRLVECRII